MTLPSVGVLAAAVQDADARVRGAAAPPAALPPQTELRMVALRTALRTYGFEHDLAPPASCVARSHVTDLVDSMSRRMATETGKRMAAICLNDPAFAFVVRREPGLQADFWLIWLSPSAHPAMATGLFRAYSVVEAVEILRLALGSHRHSALLHQGPGVPDVTDFNAANSLRLEWVIPYEG